MNGDSTCTCVNDRKTVGLSPYYLFFSSLSFSWFLDVVPRLISSIFYILTIVGDRQKRIIWPGTPKNILYYNFRGLTCLYL